MEHEDYMREALSLAREAAQEAPKFFDFFNLIKSTSSGF